MNSRNGSGSLVVRPQNDSSDFHRRLLQVLMTMDLLLVSMAMIMSVNFVNT